MIQYKVKALVCCDTLGPFVAYLDPDDDWNGWACPYFTKEEGMKIVRSLKDPYDVKLKYVPSKDEFHEYPSDNEGYSEEEIIEMGWPIVYEAETHATVDGPKTLYAIGTSIWIWDYYEGPMKVSQKNRKPTKASTKRKSVGTTKRKVVPASKKQNARRR